MLTILAFFSGVVGVVAMPTLAALLIYAAAGSLRFLEISAIWRTGLTSQIAIVTTFVATLLLPVASAVGLGVVLSLLLQLNQSALDLRVVEIAPRDDGRPRRNVRHRRVLASHTVTLIDVYGSLHYSRRTNPPTPPPRSNRLRICSGCAAYAAAAQPSAPRSSPSSPATPNNSTPSGDAFISQGSNPH